MSLRRNSPTRGADAAPSTYWRHAFLIGLTCATLIAKAETLAAAPENTETAPPATKPLFNVTTPTNVLGEKRHRPPELPLLEYANAALRTDRMDAAFAAYTRVLRTDPLAIDALLGLAIIALRQHHIEDSVLWYQRVLEIAPNEPSALSALINLQRFDAPSIAESRLKTAIANQPPSAALQFALGNLYARQQRWSEAQAAYFTAVTYADHTPDYLFNLAVSLDHLHQAPLAAQYYQAAVSATQSVCCASFDLDRARQRALELQP